MRYALAVALMLSMCFGLVTESFRYQSTARLWEDDYDLLFDPARIPQIEGARLWTGLSNFVTGNEELFSNGSAPFFYIGGTKMFGSLYPAGVYDRRSSKIAMETGLDTLMGEGVVEEIDWVYDDDGNPVASTYEKWTAEAYNAYTNSDFYVAVGTQMNDLRVGLGYLKRDNKTTLTTPSNNNTYEYIDEDIDDDEIQYEEMASSEGDDIYTMNEGTIIFSGWMDKENYSVGLQAEYAMLDSSREAIIFGYDNAYDYFPETTDESNFEDSLNLPMTGSRISGELKCFYDWNEYAQGRFYVSYFTQSMDYGDDAMNMEYADSYSINAPGEQWWNSDWTYTYYNGGESRSGFRVGTKQLFEINDRFRFGLGLFFASTSHSVDSMTMQDTMYSVETYDDNDTLVDNGYTEERWWSQTWQMDVDGSVTTWMIPVGVEFNISDPIVFRMGAEHTLSYRDFTTTRNLVDYQLPMVHIENDAGLDTTYIEDNTYTQEDVTVMDKSTSSMTNYYYGIGWHVNDNLQIDLMGFSDLTDLANWRLSATFLFD
jgi:hypothetical protein